MSRFAAIAIERASLSSFSDRSHPWQERDEHLYAHAAYPLMTERFVPKSPEDIPSPDDVIRLKNMHDQLKRVCIRSAILEDAALPIANEMINPFIRAPALIFAAGARREAGGPRRPQRRDRSCLPVFSGSRPLLRQCHVAGRPAIPHGAGRAGPARRVRGRTEGCRERHVEPNA